MSPNARCVNLRPAILNSRDLGPGSIPTFPMSAFKRAQEESLLDNFQSLGTEVTLRKGQQIASARGMAKKLEQALEFFFGCWHRNRSRPFTLSGWTYVVC